jgi:hypothetical protein
MVAKRYHLSMSRPALGYFCLFATEGGAFIVRRHSSGDTQAIAPREILALTLADAKINMQRSVE